MKEVMITRLKPGDTSQYNAQALNVALIKCETDARWAISGDAMMNKFANVIIIKADDEDSFLITKYKLGDLKLLLKHRLNVGNSYKLKEIRWLLPLESFYDCFDPSSIVKMKMMDIRCKKI
jgi:hypothetical protein